MDTIIVTRHSGTVAWLAARGIVGQVVAHATPADVAGRRAVGVLPLHLAALAAQVVVVELPGIKPEQRGADLTPEEMDAAGATLTAYTVRAEPLATLCPITGEALETNDARFVIKGPYHPCDRCRAPQPNGEGNICCACAGELDRLDQE